MFEAKTWAQSTPLPLSIEIENCERSQDYISFNTSRLRQRFSMTPPLSQLSQFGQSCFSAFRSDHYHKFIFILKATKRNQESLIKIIAFLPLISVKIPHNETLNSVFVLVRLF